jgi:hypothetical protein
MRSRMIAAATAAILALVSIIAWQAKAAAPASSVPQVERYAPIHRAGCYGYNQYCGPGYQYRCAYGRCWCGPC